MLKKLRIQFTLIAIGLVGAVLATVLGTSYYSVYTTQMNLTQEALRMSLDRNKEGEPISFANRDRGPASGMMSLSIDITDTGINIISPNPTITINPDLVGSIVEIALEKQVNSGYITEDHVIFEKEMFDDGSTRIALVDTTTRDEILRSQALTSLAIFLAAMLVVGLLSWNFSAIALKPVQRAWDQQKRFIADASHELKTPLAVILANTAILEKDKTLSKETMRWITSTHSEVDHMNSLVADLLELARTENITSSEDEKARLLKDCNFSDICTSAALEFDPVAFERHCSIQNEIEPDIHVTGDEVLLSRMVKTLLDNATKYAADQTNVYLSLEKNANKVVLKVSNSGEEIEEDELGHLFDRFYRSDKARTRGGTGGYGLGLAIAKSIVESHSGNISAASEKGQTTFTVTL